MTPPYPPIAAVSVKPPAGGTPTLNVAPTSLNVTGGAQSFALTWSNLTADITVSLGGASPNDFQLSQTGSGSGYGAGGASLTVDRNTAGSTKTIWVRKTTPTPPFPFACSVLCNSTGAAQKTVTVTYN